jgi:site-specific DNA recombinase
VNPTGAVIYVRVSDASQAETDTDGGYSLSVQKNLARLHASELGATSTIVFSEPGHTATKMRRPQLDAAIERAKQDDIGYFIVHKINRFARNTIDGLRIEQELNDHGVQLISVAEKWDNSPAGRLIKTMHFALAEMYSAELSEEVTTKMAEKARRGGTPGMCALGYLNVREDIDGLSNIARVRVDDERSPHIRWAFAEFAKGEHTLNSMQAELEDRGLTARPTKRYPKRPLSRTALSKLLRNRYYLGVVIWSGREYAGAHEPLIDAETFERVQDVLDRNNNAGDKSWRYKQYLKGTLRCWYCKEPMSFVHGRGNGGTYQYFFCRGRQRGNNCVQRYVPVWQLEEAVADRYTKVISAQVKKRRAAINAAFDTMLTEFTTNIEAETHRRQAEIVKYERQRKKILQLSYNDEMPDDLVKEELKRITGDISRATKALEITQIEIGDLEQRFRQMMNVIDRSAENYAEADDETRRAFNQFWFEWLDVRDNEIADHQLADLPDLVLDDSFTEKIETATADLQGLQARDNWDGFLSDLRNGEPDASMAPGSNVNVLVAGAGFEPATFGL